MIKQHKECINGQSIRKINYNPPHYEAMQEYKKILKPKSGEFKCTGAYPKKSSIEPIVIEFTSGGTQLKTGSSKSKVGTGTESSAKTIYPHG